MMNPYALRPMRRPLMRDPRLLIDWRGGTPFPSGGYTRPSDGLTRGADGVWRPCAPNVPRTTWGTDPVTGLLVPRYLTEPRATNLIPGNRQKFEGWNAFQGAVVTVTQGHTIPGYSPEGEATRIQTNGGAHELKYYIDTGVRPGSGPEAHSVVVQNIGAHALRVATNSSLPPVTVQPGETRWAQTAAADVSSTSNRQMQFRALDPAHDLDFLAWAPQIELTPYVTSPILDPTASSPDPTVRARDTLYVDLPDEVATPGAPLAIYARALVGADPTAFSLAASFWGITAGTDTEDRFLYLYGSPSSGRLTLQHYNGSAQNVATTSLVIEAGDLVEALALIWTDPQGGLTGELHARSVPAGESQWGAVVSAPLPAMAPNLDWKLERLYVGSRGSRPGVYEYEALKLYAGRVHGTPEQLMAWARSEI